MYFGCWDGEIKKDLAVPLKGLSILYDLLCPSLSLSLSWCFSAHQYIACASLLSVHPRIRLLSVYSVIILVSCSFLSLDRSSSLTRHQIPEPFNSHCHLLVFGNPCATSPDLGLTQLSPEKTSILARASTSVGPVTVINNPLHSPREIWYLIIKEKTPNNLCSPCKDTRTPSHSFFTTPVLRYVWKSFLQLARWRYAEPAGRLWYLWG